MYAVSANQIEDIFHFSNKLLYLLIYSCVMLENGQTCFENLAMLAPQDF